MPTVEAERFLIQSDMSVNEAPCSRAWSIGDVLEKPLCRLIAWVLCSFLFALSSKFRFSEIIPKHLEQVKILTHGRVLSSQKCSHTREIDRSACRMESRLNCYQRR